MKDTQLKVNTLGGELYVAKTAAEILAELSEKELASRKEKEEDANAIEENSI